MLHLLVLSPAQVLQQRPGKRIGSSQVGLGHSFLMFLHCTRATMRRFLCTGTHSQRRQYMTPNGGPRSANHVDPNSLNWVPNWHSGIKTNRNSGGQGMVDNNIN